MVGIEPKISGTLHEDVAGKEATTITPLIDIRALKWFTITDIGKCALKVFFFPERKIARSSSCEIYCLLAMCLWCWGYAVHKYIGLRTYMYRNIVLKLISTKHGDDAQSWF